MPAQVTPPQVEIPPVPTPKVEQPQPPATSTEPAPAALVLPAPIESTNPAIIALLERVHLDSQAGKRDSAGASLERALRIEPRNPWLWHELAQLRLEQGLYAQGTSLARKSNSFAGQERRLLALNWRVIGNVRIAQGNPQEAAQAFAVATELEQIAKPEQGVVPVPTAVSGAASAPVQTTVLGK
jgi:tetratricopeptide (TPR) repeat protein